MNKPGIFRPLVSRVPLISPRNDSRSANSQHVTVETRPCTAEQTLSISGVAIREYFETKERKKFPSFQSNNDLNEDGKAIFYLSLQFTQDGWLSAFVYNNSERPVFVQSVTWRLETNGGQDDSGEDALFENVLLKTKHFRTGYFIKPKRGCGKKNFFQYERILEILETRSHFCEFTVKASVVYATKYKTTLAKSKDDNAPCNGPTLSSDFLRLFESGQNTDVTFKFDSDGAQVRAHRTILAARSVYFERMFSSGMEESRSGVVRIADCDAAAFRIMLQFIYSDRTPSDPETSVVPGLLHLADKYLLTGLKAYCVEAISKDLNPVNLKDALVLSIRYNCPDLKQVCFGIMKSELTELERLQLLRGDELFDRSFIDEMYEFLSEDN